MTTPLNKKATTLSAWELKVRCATVFFSFFLFSVEKDSHEICVSCHGQMCSIDFCCQHCKFWTNEKWDKVQWYVDKLAE